MREVPRYSEVAPIDYFKMRRGDPLSEGKVSLLVHWPTRTCQARVISGLPSSEYGTYKIVGAWAFSQKSFICFELFPLRSEAASK